MDTGATADADAAAAAATNRRKKKEKKNRAPSLMVIANECPSVMRAHVLEVPAGGDVVWCVAQFARRGRCGVLVLGAVDHVTDVVLRPAPVLCGTMEILSLDGCFFHFPSAVSAASSAAVFLVAPQGAVMGGGVRRVIAAGPVVVMVATFVAAALDRLPLGPKSH